MSKVNVAVVGVTGAVGEVMLEILESRDFPVDTLYPSPQPALRASQCSSVANDMLFRI